MSSAKRRKVTAKNKLSARVFGGPSADDDRPRVSSQVNNPSSSGLSTRYIGPLHSPSLSSLCIQVFSNNFRTLSDEKHWASEREWIQRLPDPIAVKLFQAIQTTFPELLSHQVIATVSPIVLFEFTTTWQVIIVLLTRKVVLARWSSWDYYRDAFCYLEDRRPKLNLSSDCGMHKVLRFKVYFNDRETS